MDSRDYHAPRPRLSYVGASPRQEAYTAHVLSHHLSTHTHTSEFTLARLRPYQKQPLFDLSWAHQGL